MRVPSGDQLPEAARCPPHPAGRDGHVGCAQAVWLRSPPCSFRPAPPRKIDAEGTAAGRLIQGGPGLSLPEGPTGTTGTNVGVRPKRAARGSFQNVPCGPGHSLGLPFSKSQDEGRGDRERLPWACAHPRCQDVWEQPRQLLRPGQDGLSPQTGSIWASRHVRSNSAPPSAVEALAFLSWPLSPGCTAGVGEGGDGRVSSTAHGAAPGTCSSYVGKTYGAETLSPASVVF